VERKGEKVIRKRGKMVFGAKFHSHRLEEGVRGRNKKGRGHQTVKREKEERERERKTVPTSLPAYI